MLKFVWQRKKDSSVVMMYGKNLLVSTHHTQNKRVFLIWWSLSYSIGETKVKVESELAAGASGADLRLMSLKLLSF